jgi:hypothetical protein
MRTNTKSTRPDSKVRNSGTRTYPLDRLASVLAWSLLAVTSCTHVSCTAVNSNAMRYLGAANYYPSNPATVEILRTKPTRPHERLGEIVLDTWTEPGPQAGEVEARLREEAAQLGAHAAVVVYDDVLGAGADTSGTWWYRGPYSVNGHKLIAVAIQYR